MTTSIFSAVVLVSLLVTACNPVGAQSEPAADDSERPSRKPTWAERNEAFAPDYRSPPNAKSDCFGRLQFDVQQPIQWPMFLLSEDAMFNGAFSKKVFDRSDTMKLGDARVRVLGPVDEKFSALVYSGTPGRRIERLRTRIVETNTTLSEIRQGRETEKDRKRAGQLEEWIQQWERTIAEIESKYKQFELGLPESIAYASTNDAASNDTDRYSVFRAYLDRGAYIYVFEAQSLLRASGDFEKHRASFKKLVASFKTRAANEIPSELGVCIPFGFIPDDGKTKIEFKQSLRFPDAPGVLYTIQTGDVRSDRLKMTTIMAAARAGLGLFGTYEESEMKPFVTKRIGPRPYKMGGLTGQQGGVALHVKQPNREPFESYTVFTGYSGWLGTAVLPYILVDMNSFTKKQAPELTQNPPPFDQSMSRLELLLKSMRLRPTNPPMPELRPENK